MKRTFTLLMASLFLITGTAWAYQLSYDRTFWTVPATSHEKVTEVPAGVFTAYNENYKDQAVLDGNKVGVYADEVNVTGGTVTVKLAFGGGNIRLDICGADLVAADGTVKYSDYHFGFTGGNSDGNTYTLSGVEDGSYTLRVFVPSQKEDFTANGNDSKGTITITGAERPIIGSTAENKIFYHIKNVRSRKYANYEGAGVQFTQVTTPTLGSYWYLMEVTDAQNVPEGYKAYRIYNAANALAVENPGNGNMTANEGVQWPAKVYCIGEHTKGSTTGVVIRCLGEDGASWNDAGGNGTKIANHSYDDPGSIWEFEKANITESQLIQNAVAVKTGVLNTLAAEATNTERYYYGYVLSDIETKKAEIEAISVPETSLVDAITGAIAVSKVSSSFAGLERIAPKAGDKFTMVNKGRNSGKDGLVASAVGTDVKCLQAPFAYFDALWTLVATETEGQFKLYNEKLKVYVGVLPGNNDTKFQYVAGAEEAGVYELANVEGYATFKKVGGDDKSHLHQSGWGGKEIVRWDNGDASQWRLVKAFGPELTTDANNPICYALKSGRGNYYFTLDDNKVKLFDNKTVATDKSTHWYFMLDKDGNLKMYSKSDGKAMGYVKGTDGNTKLTNDPAATDYDSDTYTLYFAPYNQTNYNGAWFALKPSRGDTYVSNHGGTGYYMGFHNEFNDGGTRIAFESIITYTLTDKVGNRYTGTYEGVAGETVPTLSGVAGYTLSGEAWNGATYTANIEFPFPVSNAETTNATMISNFNEGQRWHAVGADVKVQKAQPTNATKEEWQWAIYPKFENGAFTFTVKNVGNGQFVTLNKEESSFDKQGTVTLTENGTALEVITWLGAPCFKVPGKTLYLTINGSEDTDVYLATYTGGNNNHGGNKLHFTEFVDVTGVTLDKTEATLTAAGATVELVATVAPENATDKTVVWSTSDDKVATVDANGVVTAVADGKATITATVGGKTATCEVTVAIVVPVTGVTLDQTEATLTAKDATLALKVTVLPENATDKTVTWTSSNEAVATVNANGVVTAVAEGTSTITATAGGFSATCVVTVEYASYNFVLLIDGKEYFKQPVKCGTALATIMTTVAEPTKEGHTFSAWVGLPDIMPAEDVTVTGSFTVNSYNVFYVVDGVPYATVSVVYGTKPEAIAAPTKEGYTFSGWVGLPDTMPAEDVTVTGSFVTTSVGFSIIDPQVIIYDIHGRRVEKMEKGLYIVNGKKVLVK